MKLDILLCLIVVCNTLYAKTTNFSYDYFVVCKYSEKTGKYCLSNEEIQYESGAVKVTTASDSVLTVQFLKNKVYRFKFESFDSTYDKNSEKVYVINGRSRKGNNFTFAVGNKYLDFVNENKWMIRFFQFKNAKADLEKYDIGSINYAIDGIWHCPYDAKRDSYNDNCKFSKYNTTINITSRILEDRIHLLITDGADTLTQMYATKMETMENDNGDSVFIYMNSQKNFIILGLGYFNIVYYKSQKFIFSSNTENSSGGFISGSSVAIAPDILITNAHVIERIKAISIYLDGTYIETNGFNIIGQLQDETMDLAILKVKGAKLNACPIYSGDVALASDVLVYGYPQIQSQGTDLKVTKGIVSGKNGFGGNKAMFQIDAAIQPGNSGGPIVSKGKIIGLATLFLKDSQNVNAGIKSSYIASFLKLYDVTPKPTITDFSKCTYMIFGE